MSSNKIVKIDQMCFETYPCKHYVTLESGEKVFMTGDKIYGLCFENSTSINPHFEIVNAKKHPSLLLEG